MRGLVVDAVSKQFFELRALDGVSLRLEQGEILGLIGPNGSGKTTLINVITGIFPPTTGRVLVNGIDITGFRPFRIARAGIARTFQRVRLFRGLSVMENVVVAAMSVGIGRRAAQDDARELLAELGLGDAGEVPADSLAYGHERLVEVARALAMQPRFLLLDEPAAGLDERESDELLRHLAPMPERRGLGMLIVDHNMSLIMRLCQHLHVLNYGKTIGDGAPEAVRRIPAVLEAYLGASHGAAGDARTQ
ncbi:MAG: ABC transporter ATP-binding protein [Rhodospirillales bacterium]|nr:ABC transporter ATP-binding protein [Rhodospirillales bacterium]